MSIFDPEYMDVSTFALVERKPPRKVLAIGKIIFMKSLPKELWSFDNINFFALDHPKYKFVDLGEGYDGPLKELEIPEDYIIKPYVGEKEFSGDVFREKDIDPEVMELVIALSSVKGVSTSGSCSGHDTNNLWVTVMFYDFPSINFITRMIQYYNVTDWDMILNNQLDHNDRRRTDVSFRIYSTHMGSIAYNKAKELADLIVSEAKKEGIYNPNWTNSLMLYLKRNIDSYWKSKGIENGS